jgi:hypothetical protein
LFYAQARSFAGLNRRTVEQTKSEIVRALFECNSREGGKRFTLRYPLARAKNDALLDGRR